MNRLHLRLVATQLGIITLTGHLKSEDWSMLVTEGSRMLHFAISFTAGCLSMS